MLYFNKEKCFFIFLISCIFLQQSAQAQSCIDTITSKQFNVENFGSTFWGSTNYQDSLGNLYLLGTKFSPPDANTPAILKSSLIKFSANKKIAWSKNYQGSLGFDDFALTRRMFGQDEGHNLYFVGSQNFGGVGNFNNGSFLKLDSSGNILANKLLVKQQPAPNGYGFSVSQNPHKIFSTIISSYTIAAFISNTFVGIDKDFTAIRWSKSYEAAVNNLISNNSSYSIELNDTTAIIATVLRYKNPLALTDTIYSFAFLKINSLTGNIIAQKSYSCFNQQNAAKSVYAYPRAVNVNYNNNEVVYQFNNVSNNTTTFSFLKIDANLDIINTADYRANTTFSVYDFNKLNNKDIILNATYSEIGITKFATINWNDNLQLTLQRSYYSSQFTGNSNYSNLTSRNTNNTINYFITSSGFFIQNDNPVYLFDNVKNPNFEYECTDKAIELFSPVQAYTFRTDAASFIEQPGLNYLLIDNPNTYTAQNNSFTENKYCDVISTCSTLKIQGLSSFCLNKGNVDSFKVNRDVGCLRKTKWSVNNAQMQILQSNDSMVKVKFLQPFKGYIKAAYENCNVADSFYIQVDTMHIIKTNVNLGQDTIQCIGKTITLNAGDGFKEYAWQNGSRLKTFTTSNTGLFFVTVKDSCNNIFKDSINILLNPQKLNLVQNGTLCEYDTAKIILPNQFTNYLWQPAANSLTSGSILLLFPKNNTLYTVSAESHKNCRVADTLQIIKNSCYESIYFPTAFTPNNDSKNDIYKPGITGILQTYKFSIFNRYGELVFTTNNAASGWDGTYKGMLLPGVFTWMCNYAFPGKQTQRVTGSFLLIK